MKKIAIDVDGVVFDSEELFRVYSEIYDVDVIGKDSVIDNSQRLYQKRYNWTTDEMNKFHDIFTLEIVEKANIMPGADIALKKISKSYEIIVVTARNDAEIKVLYSFLNQNGLENVKVFHNEHDKIDIYLEENVSYVIDDDRNICLNAAKNKIKALHFKNSAEEQVEENEYIRSVNNWGEIYKYLMYKEKNRT